MLFSFQTLYKLLADSDDVTLAFFVPKISIILISCLKILASTERTYHMTYIDRTDNQNFQKNFFNRVTVKFLSCLSIIHKIVEHILSNSIWILNSICKRFLAK